LSPIRVCYITVALSIVLKQRSDAFARSFSVFAYYFCLLCCHYFVAVVVWWCIKLYTFRALPEGRVGGEGSDSIPSRPTVFLHHREVS